MEARAVTGEAGEEPIHAVDLGLEAPEGAESNVEIHSASNPLCCERFRRVKTACHA